MSPSLESQKPNGNAEVSQIKSLNGNGTTNGPFNGTTNGPFNGTTIGTTIGTTNGAINGNGPDKIPTDAEDLKDRLRVEHSPKAFSSHATSLISLPAGSLFLKITLATPSQKAYTSVQTGPNTHIELNSDLVYINHSCNPSLVFDMEKMEVRVAEGRDLKKGDVLTFFYPCSEWDMAQPFQCSCGEGGCLGVIDGAGKMEEGVLRGYWLNKHIERLLDEKKGGEGGGVKESGN